MSEQLREALAEARKALPTANERETVICAIEGTHLRALVDALTAEPSQPKALTEFPPLPEPLVMVNRYGIGASTADGDGGVFTAAQMHAYLAADRACRLPEKPALTDEQIDKIANESGWPPSLVAKTIQAKLREFARAVEALCRGKV